MTRRTKIKLALTIVLGVAILTYAGLPPTLERGEKEPGAAVLLAISREFGKSVDWLLTGEEKK